MLANSLYFALCLFTLASTEAADGPVDNDYRLKFVDIERHPLAVCNDGSPGAYYVHDGDCPKHTFVIHQQGGWWCWDDYSCKVRWQHFEDRQLRAATEKRHLMSSRELQNTTMTFNTFNGEKNTGLMVTRNATVDPHFYRASKVFIAYCSSDSHAGNRTVETSDGSGMKWHFRGKEIVKAVISELLEQHGLGAAEILVLTGGSAGGMATVANGDWLPSLLPPMPQRRYIAYPDAGVFMDVMPNRICDNPDIYECKCAAGSGCGTVTVADQMQKMVSYTGGLPDASCSKRLGRWGTWRCFLGQFAWPYFSETFLLNQMQTDEWQAFWNGFSGWADASRPQEREYGIWFRREVVSMLEDINISSHLHPNIYAFSPNCVIHTFTYDPHWWEIKVAGRSSRDVIGALAMGVDVHPKVIVDDCEGLECSIGCRNHMKANGISRAIAI